MITKLLLPIFKGNCYKHLYKWYCVLATGGLTEFLCRGINGIGRSYEAGLVNIAAENRQLRAVLMPSRPPPSPGGVRGAFYLFLPSASGQVRWVAGVDSVGNYCILVYRSDFSLVSELPEAVDDAVKLS